MMKRWAAEWNWAHAHGAVRDREADVAEISGGYGHERAASALVAAEKEELDYWARLRATKRG